MADVREDRLSESELVELDSIVAAASPAPWIASVEGRDHTSGDDVILVGNPREEDMYVSRDTTAASAADLDFMAAARNHLPALIAEVRRARSAKTLLRSQDKKPFLVVDDYGMGGIWMYVCAPSPTRSPSDIPI